MFSEMTFLSSFPLLSSSLLLPSSLSSTHTHTQTQVSVDPSQDAVQVVFSERDTLVVTDDTKFVFYCSTVSAWVEKEKGGWGGGDTCEAFSA